MTDLKIIDKQLEDVAERFGCEIFTSGSQFWIGDRKVPPELAEERRIMWFDGNIAKIALILPVFDRGGDYSIPRKWLFELGAVLEDGEQHPAGAPFWSRRLLTRASTDEMVRQIDALLSRAEDLLGSIDLLDPTNHG